MLPWCFLCSPGLLVIGGLQFLGEERQAKECDLVGISSHKIRSWEAFHKEPDRKYFRHCQPHAVPVTAALHRPAGAAFPPEASWRTQFPCLFQLSVLLLTDSLRWPRLALNSEFRSSCLHLPSIRTTGGCHHTWFLPTDGDQTQNFVHLGQALYKAGVPVPFSVFRSLTALGSQDLQQ